MEHVKICAICRKKISEYSCMNCGSLVCTYCYSKQRNICIKCISGKNIVKTSSMRLS